MPPRRRQRTLGLRALPGFQSDIDALPDLATGRRADLDAYQRAIANLGRKAPDNPA